MLRQTHALHQFPHQQGFFKARQRAVLSTRQQAQQRLGHVAPPLLDAGGVATDAMQRGNAPIAVDQHKPFPARGRTAGNSHHNARNDLAAALDGMSDAGHGARFHQAAAGKAQFQEMQVEFQVLAVHGRHG